MSVNPRSGGDGVGRSFGAYQGLMVRVQDQLTAQRKARLRHCPLCGEPIRGGQKFKRVHGTAVHESCTRSAAGPPS